ncbi:uncharacterized protein LOC132556091 [Ylistrum balloti]|uniref:uncharacterized protein LOC132556091 n=1 Tax=Ylistrum balloti TaxID=509963 RepID=UPI002905AA5C|nr:uncharacterized protein LOC132556091 [Ylistrum balloti]
MVVGKWVGIGDALPAKAFHVALYLVSLAQTANTPSPIVNAYYSLKWFHDLYDLDSPTKSNLVRNVLEASKRRLAKPVVKKKPMTVDLLLSMYKSKFSVGNLKNQRIRCACLLAFAGFLRSDELLRIRVCDVMFASAYMSVFIESSKTDKYRDGAWLMIAETGTCLCPVKNLKLFFDWASLKENSDQYIFCSLSPTKDGYKARSDNKSMSYTTLRELFIEAFKPLVEDMSQFCLHSLRAGGATAAAKNGIEDRLFKRHGRWVSENAKDGYVEDSFTERLKVSESLGL